MKLCAAQTGAGLVLGAFAAILTGCSFEMDPEFAQGLQDLSSFHVVSFSNETDCPVKTWVQARIVGENNTSMTTMVDGPWIVPERSQISVALMANPDFANAVVAAEHRMNARWFEEVVWVVDTSIEPGQPTAAAWHFQTRVPLLPNLEYLDGFFFNMVQLTHGVGRQGAQGGPDLQASPRVESGQEWLLKTMPTTPTMACRDVSAPQLGGTEIEWVSFVRRESFDVALDGSQR